MSNFSFLITKPDYALFSPACMEAEKIYATAPAMCAVGCRKALELAVKWVYSADNTMKMPYKDNLQSLIHEPTFRSAVDYNTWGKLPFISLYISIYLFFLSRALVQKKVCQVCQMVVLPDEHGKSTDTLKFSQVCQKSTTFPYSPINWGKF